MTLPSFEKHTRKKKSNKTQKDVLRQTKSISPPAYDIASVYTGPIEPFNFNNEPIKDRRPKKKGKRVIFDVCECNDEIIESNGTGKYVPKTWDSITKHYGDTNTTQLWMEPGNQTGKAYKRDHKNKKLKNLEVPNGDATYIQRDTKIHKRKPKIQKRHYSSNKHHLSKLKQQDKIVSENPDAHDKASVISLFRREHKHTRKTETDTLKLEKTVKSQRTNQQGFPDKTSVEKKCSEGPCVEATKNKNNNFLCRCVNRKKEPEFIAKECTQATCGSSRNLSSIKSVVKMKDKILCMCQKYSQKIISLKPSPNMICREGLCHDAAKLQKHDFICKCDKNQNIRECSNNTCGKYTNANTNDTVKIRVDQDLIKSKLSKQQNIYTKSGQLHLHESEQTGEPFFEIQVNPRDMCVLNPIEIKENILKFGRAEKKELKCLCPSRGRLGAGEVCKSGVCKKAYKNKQTNFNCWCDKKIAECSDTTCGFKGRNTRRQRKYDKHIDIQKPNKPLLEVQLDIDKMCVVNPKEIEDKMINNITVDEVCSSGICRNAALKHKGQFHCKCIGRKINAEITECTKDTCIDVNQKKKSKFCLFCTRICSKSENWSPQNRNRNQKRVKRSSFYEIGANKLCRGKICTKSENLHGSNGLSFNHMDLKQFPTCHCEECKSPKKSTLLKLKPIENLLTRQTNDVSKITLDKNNDARNIRSQKTEEIKPISSNQVKQSDTHNTFQGKTIISTKEKVKLQRKKLAQKRRDQIVSQRHFEKESRRRAKLDKKREKIAAKARLKEIKIMQKKMKEEPLDTNFCTALVLGILKIGLKTTIFIFYIIFTIIKDPKGSFWYVRDRIKDPEGTCDKLRKWFNDAIMIKKLQVSETFRGSDTLNILADHFQDTPFYQSFADKGRTKKEQMLFEQKSKARKRRIRKRQHQAIHSCRHTLLTTLRQTPCLWVYHICPNFYPQCLSLLSFMRSFSHILMFLAAFACWTPCIVSFELCRAFLCCFMCTN